MARGVTWGPWPPPHAHGPAQQQCPSAQAGPSKGLGQPMTPALAQNAHQKAMIQLTFLEVLHGYESNEHYE